MTNVAEMTQLLTDMLIAARAEGRAAGLEEAKVICFEETQTLGPERCGAKRAYDRIYALVTSDGAGKVGQPDRMPCGCVEADGCEDAT